MDINIIHILKIIVFTSVLFVWVVRYQNIVEEFKLYGYPSWLRDFVGILKISFVIMILNADTVMVKAGSLGICILMLFALFTHIKVKNNVTKMIPALSLFILSIVFYLAA